MSVQRTEDESQLDAQSNSVADFLTKLANTPTVGGSLDYYISRIASKRLKEIARDKRISGVPQEL